MSVTVGQLVDKYERMIALRGVLGHGAPSPAHRERLRALAREFPGALRELETLGDIELASRLAQCRAAAAGGVAPSWLDWMAAYHALMRRALERRAGSPRPADTPADADDEFAAAIRAPRHGRMNVVVFEALARRFALPAATLWDALFPRRGLAPRPYRR